MDLQSDIREISSLLTDDELRCIEVDGYVILRYILPDAECDLLSRLTDEIWARENFGKIYDDEPGVQFVPNLLKHSLSYERLVTEPRVLGAVQAMLGRDIWLDRIIGRRSDPGWGNQALHDLSRRRGRPFFKTNAIWCLDEFTTLNGATRVIPGSHMTGEPFLSRCTDPSLPHPDERVVTAPRGSVIVHNSHIIHGGTLNRSGGPRRSIHSAYTSRDVPPHTDWNELPAGIRASLSAKTRELTGL